MAALQGTSKSVRWGDANYEKQLLTWYNEIDSDDSDNEPDPNEIKVSEHDTESEQEDDCEDIGKNKEKSDNEEEELEESEEDEIRTNYLYGKDRYKWSKKPPVSKNTRTMKHNIVTKLPGIKERFYGEKKMSALSIWTCLVTDDILEIIIRWTNVRLRRERLKYKNQNHSDLRDLDITELKSFIGLLFFTSIFKCNTEDIRSIFATDGSGRDIFRCVTNANRFAIILVCLRFDNPGDRNERKKHDPIAPISEVFNSFVGNCQSLYTLGIGACIDEMLIAFRGRSKYKIYMPNKPAKYGLKLMALTDARTSYFYNGYLYCGKDSDGLTLSDEDRRKWSKPSQSVLRLAKPIFGSNRNLTADNWFSSVELVDVLQSKQLTYVGTLKKNKRQIPKEFLPSRFREVGSSVYGFTKTTTMVSYVPKRNKSVILISSQHHHPCSNPETGKPEIVDYYNNNKGGVDSLDEKCAKYSTARRTRRWPMCLFFRVLDISSVNSYILHQSFPQNPELTRYSFVKTLAFELVTPALQRRCAHPLVNREVRACIRRVLKVNEEFQVEDEEEEEGKLKKRKTCSTCPSARQRKTAYFCYVCKRPICLQCSRHACKMCSS